MLADSRAVAFLGIGLMGSRQAKRLLDAGHKVIAWNRSREKAEALRSFGADVVDTAAEAARSADVLILMLENGQIVRDVLFLQGAADALRPGCTVIDMSSIKPSEAKDHARRLADRGVHHIDAPVSGGTLGAEQGTLAIMAGGDADVFAKVMPILSVMGHAVHVGPHGAGQLAKLANQVIVGVTIGAVAEALLLAERGGADPAKVREALRGGFAESRILELHGRRMVERDFETKGRSVTHLKDLDNALDAAEGIGIETLPYTAITADLFRCLIQNAGDLDHSGLLVELEHRNSKAQ
ncbi:NAD(P)-dependent oxidoreductase [Microvirga puerhi]|uniref:NAD(P)-dependent oxidoreductase n=1 Tax=Microvirga puerhi TaxID=2876078 RepID=A0ABS7VHZ5_9HYPH|nr:NAD(P)-dependent oxidoreductase [Microvirga puerhi]MBZ6075133.1 NAD(P)-dependent oxidoreductase [Microvirga puerhi]